MAIDREYSELVSVLSTIFYRKLTEDGRAGVLEFEEFISRRASIEDYYPSIIPNEAAHHWCWSSSKTRKPKESCTTRCAVNVLLSIKTNRWINDRISR